MLQNFLGEGESQICFFVVGIVGDACLGIGNSQSVVLELDVRERSVGVVDGQFVFGHSRALHEGELDGLAVGLHCLLELVVLELVVALLLTLLAF
jgi:hypothetical protein